MHFVKAHTSLSSVSLQRLSCLNMPAMLIITQGYALSDSAYCIDILVKISTVLPFSYCAASSAAFLMVGTVSGTPQYIGALYSSPSMLGAASISRQQIMENGNAV